MARLSLMWGFKLFFVAQISMLFFPIFLYLLKGEISFLILWVKIVLVSIPIIPFLISIPYLYTPPITFRKVFTLLCLVTIWWFTALILSMALEKTYGEVLIWWMKFLPVAYGAPLTIQLIKKYI
jgi:cellulose synthase/poly-beta-1,6-N-acetylglucosamine synthase-like glycosyltransferase